METGTNREKEEPAGSLTPLVSVVVCTKDSERYLVKCLESVKAQTYNRLEVIVVDNFSTDNTRPIAAKYADIIVEGGPERSAQMNLGAEMAQGAYVFRVDADFELERTVVEECVSLCGAGASAVIVHNSPDVTVGLLARIRKFEVDMYKYSLNHTAARFIDRQLFRELGGLREDVTAGEDYDLQNRLRRYGAKVAWANAEATHLGEPVALSALLRKYFVYGVDFVNYHQYNRSDAKTQLAFLRRDYVSHWREFVRHPILGCLFVGYHIAKYAAGGLGYLVGSIARTGFIKPGPHNVCGSLQEEPTEDV